MGMFFIGIIIFIIICLLLILFINLYNHYQCCIIRINEAETFIDATLRKRFDLLNKAINIIKSNTKTKEVVLETIVELKSKKLDNYELDKKLYEAINEFNKFKEDYPSLNEVKGFIKIDLGLFESESEIVSARKYYNDIVTTYNKYTTSFPYNIVSKVCKYEAKILYDNKEEDN